MNYDDDDAYGGQQQQQKVLLQKKASVTTTSASKAAKGYVATQTSLNGLIQELLATVKGLRREQKEQKELIEDLTTQLDDQKRLVTRMQRQQVLSNDNNNNNIPEPESNDPSIPPPPPSEVSDYASDLAKLRRELVGMIGSAMAQHEEELAAALSGNSNITIKSRCDCPCCCNSTTDTTDINSEKINPPPQSMETYKQIKEITSPKESTPAAAVPFLPVQPDLEDFRVNVLPKLLAQRTFHANGASILGRLPSSVTSSTTSYIDCPMKMILTTADSNANDTDADADSSKDGKATKDKRRYTWSVEVIQQPGSTSQWAVGIALLSSATKWETSATTNNSSSDSINDTSSVWLLGGKKGEWGYRSDGTLWSHAKQRKTITSEASSKDGDDDGSGGSETTATKSKVTVTLEFQQNNKLVLRGSVVRLVPSPPQKLSSSVWFEIPWNNFKKPSTTAFVPAVTVQDGCLMRFLGWE